MTNDPGDERDETDYANERAGNGAYNGSSIGGRGGSSGRGRSRGGNNGVDDHTARVGQRLGLDSLASSRSGVGNSSAGSRRYGTSLSWSRRLLDGGGARGSYGCLFIEFSFSQWMLENSWAVKLTVDELMID